MKELQDALDFKKWANKLPGVLELIRRREQRLSERVTIYKGI